ncbi:MAG: cysteine--tRNA ligase [Euryarchaeota archaeon]
MVLRLYDTLSRRKKELSYSGDEVTIYACGITPYSPSHIGHARQAIAFDTLVRWLNFNDIPTKYVTNFTDISDTIIQAAADEGVEFTEISERHIDSYMKSMAALNVLQADAYPRVTESIDSIIKMIEKLVRKGHAYIADDGVYFEIDTAPEKYGALTGQTLEMVRSGAGGRVDNTGLGKRDPRDFALWKLAKTNEPFWESPFGAGRPGWHIECSAMVFDQFGEQVDIHGGGSDLMFPHHEAEIFQSECCHGAQPFARHWMHNGMININGEKMSKSLGNFWTVAEAIDVIGPLVLRYALINAPYRQPIDFNQVLLEDAKKNHRRMIDSIKEGGGLSAGTSWQEHQSLLDSERKLVKGMNDDLNTRVAIAETQSVVRALNRANSSGNSSLAKACIGWLSAFAGEILGVIPDMEKMDEEISSKNEKLGLIESEVIELIKLRNVAREARNWQEADRIREVLSNLGVELQDGERGTTWNLKDD